MGFQTWPFLPVGLPPSLLQSPPLYQARGILRSQPTSLNDGQGYQPFFSSSSVLSPWPPQTPALRAGQSPGEVATLGLSSCASVFSSFLGPQLSSAHSYHSGSCPCTHPSLPPTWQWFQTPHLQPLTFPPGLRSGSWTKVASLRGWGFWSHRLPQHLHYQLVPICSCIHLITTAWPRHNWACPSPTNPPTPWVISSLLQVTLKPNCPLLAFSAVALARLPLPWNLAPLGLGLTLFLSQTRLHLTKAPLLHMHVEGHPDHQNSSKTSASTLYQLLPDLFPLPPCPAVMSQPIMMITFQSAYLPRSSAELTWQNPSPG